MPPANEKIECNKSPDCHAVPLCGWLTAPAADAYLDIRVHEGTHRSVHRRRHRAPPQSAAIGVGPAAQASVLDPGARPRKLRAAEWTPVNIRKCGYCQERAPSNTSRCWPRRPPPSDAAMSVNEFARRKLGGGLPSSGRRPAASTRVGSRRHGRAELGYGPGGGGSGGGGGGRSGGDPRNVAAAPATRGGHAPRVAAAATGRCARAARRGGGDRQPGGELVAFKGGELWQWGGGAGEVGGRDRRTGGDAAAAGNAPQRQRGGSKGGGGGSH